ncbi:MAG TPA: DsbA family protein [Nitrospirota bacterium]|nr:DsbA family protein [Nitrospirota bacterium]
MKERFVLIVISFSVCLSLILSLYPVTEAADMANSKSDEEIKALRKEMQDLRKDVEDLKTKTIVRQQVPAPEPQEVVVSMNDDPVKGDLNAPVTIIEFSDFQCPYCGRFFKSTLTEIERDYIKTGKVRYVFRDFPLDFHKQAPKASEAANCAGEQGKYWEMHDKLFENQNALMVDKLRQYAAEVGLESGPFDACLDSGKYAEEINRDVEDGKKAGVSGTPSFFIGKSQGPGKEITGKRIVGARPYESFKQVIDQILADQGK